MGTRRKPVVHLFQQQTKFLDTWESYDFSNELYDFIQSGGTDGEFTNRWVDGNILGVAISTFSDENNPSRVTVLTPERIDNGENSYNLYETYMMTLFAEEGWVCLLSVYVDTFSNGLIATLESLENSTTGFSPTLDEWKTYSPKIYIKTS